MQLDDVMRRVTAAFDGQWWESVTRCSEVAHATDALLVAYEQLEDENRRLKAEIAKYQSDIRHLIELRDDGWTIQHPLSCRPDLFSCGFNMAARDMAELGQHPNGRYFCTVDDYMNLIIQEEVTDE